MSDEPILQDFNYLDYVHVQRSIQKVTLEKVRPVNQPVREHDVVFDIPKSVAFTALHQSKLVVEVAVTKAEGEACNHSAAANPDTVSVVNNLLHSMWKSVSIEINGHTVETVNQYPYRAYVDTLTSFDQKVMDVRGVLQGWAKDTAGQMSITTTGGENAGLNARGNMIASSKLFKMKGRLHTDIWLQGRSIPPNTSIKVTLSPASDDFVLLGAATKKYELHVRRAYLEVVRQHVPPSLTNAVLSLKSNKPLSINYRNVNITSHNIKEGEQSATVTLFESEKSLPDRFFVFFVRHDAYNRKINFNPFHFEHLNVKSLTVDFNGNTLPGQTYTPDFSKKVVDEYTALLEEFDADENNHIINITPTEFAAGYTIFPFRLVHRTAGGECLGPKAVGSVSLEIKFATALDKVITAVVLAEYRESLEFRAPGEISQA